MFCCLATKALCIITCPAYSTATFLVTYLCFCAIHGQPSKVFTDHGPKLWAHASEQELSLADIAEEARKKGMVWILSTKACSWRSGQAEVTIRLEFFYVSAHLHPIQHWWKIMDFTFVPTKADVGGGIFTHCSTFYTIINVCIMINLECLTFTALTYFP